LDGIKSRRFYDMNILYLFQYEPFQHIPPWNKK